MVEPQQEGEPNGALIWDVNNNDDGRGLLGESASDDDTSMDDDTSNDSDDDESDDEESVVVPTPDEVELEYTFPDDFRDRELSDVIEDGRYFRLIINCEAVRDIPEGKFELCGMLIEIVFLNNNKNNQRNILRYIRNHAFFRCFNLQRIRNGLPGRLAELGRCAFAECFRLQQGLAIPRSVLLVDRCCFYYCVSITSVEFGHLPTDFVELRDEAFSLCNKLRSVTLPMSLRSIPHYCFYECVALINIPIPIPVRIIETCAFCGCSALRHIDLSENITEIRQNAYTECIRLETITIKSSTVQFGDHAFDHCLSLSWEGATIKVYPWVLPRLFAAMNGLTADASNFRYKFLRKSQHQLAQFRRR